MTTGERFAEALRRLEETGDIEPMTQLFAHHAHLVLTTTNGEFHGRDGAREFWQRYLSMFERIDTHIEDAVESGGRATLRWSKSGRLSSIGGPVHYRGVTVVTYGEDGLIHSLRTSYDTVDDHAVLQATSSS